MADFGGNETDDSDDEENEAQVQGLPDDEDDENEPQPGDPAQLDVDRAQAGEDDVPPFEQIEALIRAQAAADQRAQAQIDAAVAAYQGLDDATKKARLAELATAAKTVMRNRLDAEMRKVRYASGFADLEKLSDAVANDARFQNNADAARSRGTEFERRRQFMNAVQAVRESEIAGFDWASLFQDATACAYDAILVAAGLDDFEDNRQNMAGLRIAQQRFFSGRAVCQYMDTGLLCVTHKDMKSDAGLGSARIGTYESFDYLNSPYIGVAGVRDDFIYKTLNKRDLLPPVDRVTLADFRMADNDAARATLRTRLETVDPAIQIGRDGDIAGRAVRAHHFAVLEQLLLQNPDINWREVKDQYNMAGVTMLKAPGGGGYPRLDTPSLLEDFDGRLATEYTALMYRVVHETPAEWQRLSRGAGDRLPAIPGYQAGGITDPLFGNLSLQKLPPMGRTLTDSQREKAARDYVRRVVYAACYHSWYPHSMAFVHLLTTLEHAAFNNWAEQRSFLDRAQIRQKLADEMDDLTAQGIKQLRSTDHQIATGAAEVASDAVKAKAVQYSKEKYAVTRGERAAAGALAGRRDLEADRDIVANPAEHGRYTQGALDFGRKVRRVCTWKWIKQQWQKDPLMVVAKTAKVAGTILVIVGVGRGIYNTAPIVIGWWNWLRALPTTPEGMTDLVIDVAASSATQFYDGQRKVFGTLAERSGVANATRAVLNAPGDAANVVIVAVNDASTAVQGAAGAAAAAATSAGISVFDASNVFAARAAGVTGDVYDWVSETSDRVVTETVELAQAAASTLSANSPTAARGSRAAQSDVFLAGYERQVALDAAADAAGLPREDAPVSDLTLDQLRAALLRNADVTEASIRQRNPAVANAATLRELRSASASARKGQGKRTADEAQLIAAPVVMPRWLTQPQSGTDFFAKGALAARKAANLL